MARLYIDLSGRGGLAKKFAGDIVDSSGSPQLRYLAENGQMVQGTFNPIRKFGFLAPVPGAFTTVTENDATSAFTSEWRATVYDSDSNELFAAENGNLIWGIATGGLTVWKSGTGGGAPPITANAATKLTDLEIYQINGSKRVFASYMKTGGGDILLGTPDGTGSLATNATWLSGTVSGAFNTGATSDVFMRVADNGLMYIFDSSAIHKLDGTTNGGANGTVTANVVVFPTGIYTVDAVDWRGSMWVAIQSTALIGVTSAISGITGASRVIGVYVWDRKSSVVGSVDYIPIGGVREIRRLFITTRGELQAITISSQGLTQIRRYNGSTFEVIAELGVGAFPRFRDSFGYLGDLAVWLGYDGLIYAHGSIAAGEKEGLYTIGDVTGVLGASSNSGAIIIVDNSGSATATRAGILWSGTTNGGTPHNRYLYPHSTGTAPLAGNAYSPVKYLPKLSTVDYVNIFCAPTASAAATTIATVDVYFNQSTTSAKTHTVTMAQASRGYITIPLGKPYVNSIQLKVSWDTGTTIGTSDFLPSVAEVVYTPEENFK